MAEVIVIAWVQFLDSLMDDLLMVVMLQRRHLRLPRSTLGCILGKGYGILQKFSFSYFQKWQWPIFVTGNLCLKILHFMP